eukprot:1159727-Pelagomonas_calceolata.AAC.14
MAWTVVQSPSQRSCRVAFAEATMSWSAPLQGMRLCMALTVVQSLSQRCLRAAMNMWPQKRRARVSAALTFNFFAPGVLHEGRIGWILSTSTLRRK